ncbi:MAG: phosphatase PAP2 family protein [Sphingomonadaceae bacterium]
MLQLRRCLSEQLTQSRLGVLLALASLAAMVDTVIAITGALQPLNASLTAAAYKLAQPWLDVLMVGFTYLGSVPSLSLIIAAAALWALGRSYWRSALLMVGTAAVAHGTAYLTKLVVQAPRPFLRQPPGPLTLLEDRGFPSGHALSSVAILGIAAVVAWTLVDRPWSRRLLPAATILAVAGIGFSRVYLGLHWFNDVVGGYLYGCVILLVSVALHRCLVG